MGDVSNESGKGKEFMYLGDDYLETAASIVYSSACFEHPDLTEDKSFKQAIIRLSGLEKNHNLKLLAHARVGFQSAQERLSKLNEMTPTRKKKGVYYTPQDVVNFVVKTAVTAYHDVRDLDDFSKKKQDQRKIDAFLYETTIFDPTCGLGEFLLEALRLKLDLFQSHGNLNDSARVNRVLQTVRGNDIDPISVRICRLRIFMEVLRYVEVTNYVSYLGSIEQMFSQKDFIEGDIQDKLVHDIILGNPPYVEDRIYGHAPKRYGNVYCNVLINATSMLSERGVLAFIIPLSYISTPRMRKIRNELLNVLPKQTVFSFADRPDSLFKQVHQKLCILVAEHGVKQVIRTSNYQYWYKDERQSLLAGIPIIQNPFANDLMIPKLGNESDISIFKLLIEQPTPTFYEVSREGAHVVSLNRRETFWMKAFRENKNHPEFKEFHFRYKKDAALLYCVLNSSLFWWYWIAISDCWHVNRSLHDFKLPSHSYDVDWISLADQLESALEQTKKYVATKQVMFEYKHSECIELIHEIDDHVNLAYGLSAEQSEYIKTFALDYRMSRRLS